MKHIRQRFGAYYYRIPRKDRKDWDGKSENRIGTTEAEANAFYKQHIHRSDDELPIELVETLAERLLRRSRISARSRKIDYDLTLKDVNELVTRSNGKCELSGVTLSFGNNRTAKSNDPWMPTIDRINSVKSYSFENCRVTCLAINVAMGAWGEEIFSNLCAAYVQKKLSPHSLPLNQCFKT